MDLSMSVHSFHKKNGVNTRRQNLPLEDEVQKIRDHPYAPFQKICFYLQKLLGFFSRWDPKCELRFLTCQIMDACRGKHVALQSYRGCRLPFHLDG